MAKPVATATTPARRPQQLPPLEMRDGEGNGGGAAAGGEGGRGAGEADVRGVRERGFRLRDGRRVRPGRMGLRPGVRLDLGDPAAQAGNTFLCHENAGVHGFSTRR